MFICRESKDGGKLASYSTASLGLRGSRVGGDTQKRSTRLNHCPWRKDFSAGESAQDRSGPTLKEAWGPPGGP